MNINSSGLLCGESVLKSKLEKTSSAFEKKEIFNEAATKFSQVARNVVTLLGIEDIILDGYVFNSYPDFFEIMGKKLMQQKYVSEKMSLNIKRAEIIKDSGALGVSLALAERILNALSLSKLESEKLLSLSVPYES